jgi:imidazolonepropionase-like amidohydrolase
VAAGLPWAAGLAAITRNVGQILHLGPGVGMLELGQAADFAVYDGDPLSLDGHVRLVSIRGIVEDRPDQL